MREGFVPLPAGTLLVLAAITAAYAATVELLKSRQLLPKTAAGLDVFFLIEDESLRDQSLKLIQDLRSAGLMADFPLAPAKADKQFKRAQELNAAHTVKLERAESGEPVAKIRNLSARQEKTVSSSNVLQHFRPHAKV